METIVRIGGVPEHFNYPWHKAKAEGRFERYGISLQWSDYPGGTGVLVQDLADKKLDLAVLLTEGAVAAVSKGCPARLLHFTVRSPLIWGVHTGTASSLQDIESIKGKTFAISRFGSGSHLMAIVQALLNDWPLDHMHWLEVKNLEGAKKALTENQADVFLWERFMTKPLVDEGSFRLLGLLPTPWPSFVLVAREDFLVAHPDIVKYISTEILSVQEEIKNDPDLSFVLAKRYGLKQQDVLVWLNQTTWEKKSALSEVELDAVSQSLLKAGVLEDIMPAKKLIAAL
ncbi:MAG TPA: ABC transporter substrate-binding protein [Cytophagaceae bacterium]|jgi:sulfonate transport system substrate-binding protein|nr:ABC transporter substrate-binding protein [Cytophagaceae bacterium]